MLNDVEKFDNGLVIFKPRVFKDDRGYFMETFNEVEWNLDVKFVQDNESTSSKNVIRGLHYQYGEYAQAKLVRVVRGAVIDFVLDIRKNSKTYGQMKFVKLSEDNKFQFFIPRGFAHGFVSLTDNTIFSYKCDNYYNKGSERGINIFSPSLNILEKLKDQYGQCINFYPEEFILSPKDKEYPIFE